MNNFLFEPPKFLNPERTLFAAGLSLGQSLADLGTGSGFYAVAAGKIVGPQGQVVAVDILDSALDHVAAEARLAGLRNLKTLKADLEQADCCLSLVSGSLDAVLFANTAHQVKNHKQLFAEAYRLLKTGGKLIVLEWNDERGPIGPPVQSRISSSTISTLAASSQFKSAGNLPTDNYHYGLMFIK